MGIIHVEIFKEVIQFIEIPIGYRYYAGNRGYSGLVGFSSCREYTGYIVVSSVIEVNRTIQNTH